MPIITWDQSLSVGVVKIDEQHQNLIAMINDLYDAMSANQGNEIVEDILGRMAQYTRFHFTTEEKYFDEFDYDESDIHRAQHQEFVEKTREFISRMEQKKILPSQEVMNFLRGWLVAHINNSDKKYTKCFNEHGLE